MREITVEKDVNRVVVYASGSLTGSLVSELESCWKNMSSFDTRNPIRLDLSGVNSVDKDGKALLSEMVANGVTAPSRRTNDDLCGGENYFCYSSKMTNSPPDELRLVRAMPAPIADHNLSEFKSHTLGSPHSNRHEFRHSLHLQP